MVDAFNLTVQRGHEGMALTNIATSANLINAQTDQPGEKFQMGSIKVDLGAARSVQQVALLYTDCDPLNPGELVLVYSAANADLSDKVLRHTGLAMTDMAVDPGAGYRHVLVHLAAAVSARYWQVELTGGGQRNVGRLIMGAPLQVEYNPDYGDTSWGLPETDEPEVTDAGITILQERPADLAPVFEFNISWATEAEMEQAWQAFSRLAPRAKPVLVVRRPDVHPYRHSGIFWGLLRLQPFVAAQFDMHEVRGKIKAML